MSNTSETQEHIIFGYLHEHMAYISSTIGSYLKELYDNASEAHQHVILDMCANANVQKSKNTSKTAPWGSHSTSPNSTHPALTVIMRALKNGMPLEEVDGYHEKVFNPDTQKYAYQRASEGVNYDAYYAWEYLKATHQVNSIFEETDTTSLPDITPAMKEWLEDTASESEMVLTTKDTYIF